MTVKQICNVLYDNQKIEIYVYESRRSRSYELVVWGVAQQFRNSNNSNGNYADARVDVVVPSGRTMLIYLD